MQRWRQQPIAPTRLGAFGEVADNIEGAALAGRGPLDGTVLRVDTAHPDLDAARAEDQPVTRRNLAAGNRAGRHHADTGKRKHPIHRQTKSALDGMRGSRGVGGSRAVGKKSGKRRDALTGTARHWEDGGARVARRSQERRHIGDDRLTTRGIDAVDLGDHRDDFRNPYQLEDVEVLEGLRPRSIIGGDDQQHAIDRQNPGQHIGEKPLVTGDVDETEFGAVRQYRVSKTEIDRQTAALFFGQAVGVDAGQRPHQSGLAVIDMPGCGEDHLPLSNASCPVNPAWSSRQRKSKVSAPPVMCPITGIGRSRNNCASLSTAFPARETGRSASPALGSSDTGSAPLPIWLLASTISTAATPSRAEVIAGNRRSANAAISAFGRVSSRSAGNRSASRSGSA